MFYGALACFSGFSRFSRISVFVSTFVVPAKRNVRGAVDNFCLIFIIDRPDMKRETIFSSMFMGE